MSQVSPPLFSTELRFREFQEHAADEQAYKAMRGYFGQCRKLEYIIAEFGLQNHDFLNREMEHCDKLNTRAIALAVYHCDGVSQFLQHKRQRVDLKKFRENEAKRRRADPAAVAQALAEKDATHLDIVIWKAAVEHTQSTIDTESYYVARLRAGTSLQSFRDRFRTGLDLPEACEVPGHMAEALVAVDGDDAGVGAADPAGGPADDLVAGAEAEAVAESSALVPVPHLVMDKCMQAAGALRGEVAAVAGAAMHAGGTTNTKGFVFRAVHVNPSLIKIPGRTDLEGSIGSVLSTEMAVTLHTLGQVDDPTITVSLDPAQPRGVVDPTCLWQPPIFKSQRDWNSAVNEWTRTGPIRFMSTIAVAGCSDELVQKTCSLLVDASALPLLSLVDAMSAPFYTFNKASSDDSVLRCLQGLHERGAVLLIHDYTDRSCWRLSDIGLTSLQSVVDLKPTRSLFRCHRPYSGDLDDLQQFTKFELWDCMARSGWEFELLAPRTKLRDVPAYAAGDAKKLFIRRSSDATLPFWRMLAHVAVELRQLEGPLPPLQTEKTYAALLDPDTAEALEDVAPGIFLEGDGGGADADVEPMLALEDSDGDHDGDPPAAEVSEPESYEPGAEGEDPGATPVAAPPGSEPESYEPGAEGEDPGATPVAAPPGEESDSSSSSSSNSSSSSAPAAPPLPPPLAPPAAPAPAAPRPPRDPSTFDEGPFHFTWKMGRRGTKSSWQVLCRVHGVGCTRTRSLLEESVGPQGAASLKQIYIKKIAGWPPFRTSSDWLGSIQHCSTRCA